MPIITLPNGDQKQFDHAVSVMEVAQSIGPGLAKIQSLDALTAVWLMHAI